MALPFYNWSRTAASNATADSTVNWAEGQAPSSVNDSGRAMMASTAAFRDDIAGAIVTGGTSTNYTVSSYQVFDTLAHMSGKMIAFTPHTTNGAGGTNLNVDGLGLKPIYSAPSTAIPAGVLVQGTPYVALYNNSDAAWYLQNFYVNPYQVPLGGMLDYIGTSAPNSAFVIPIGQAISRTTYATLFSLISTTYGTGDGSTTFNVPDLTGRIVAMKEASATRLTTAGGGVDGGTLGAVGGSQNQTLASGQIPSLTSSGSNSISVTSTVNTLAYGFTTGSALANNGGSFYGAASATNPLTIGSVTSTGSNSISVSYTNASPSAVKTVQPTIILNKILRVL
jgi:microcystin-dependent protein